MATLHVDVVSAEEQIFSGEATFVALPGESGELGIMPRHTPLITRIKPGAVRIQRADTNEEEFVFVAGGDAQPHRTLDCLTACPRRLPDRSPPTVTCAGFATSGAGPLGSTLVAD